MLRLFRSFHRGSFGTGLTRLQTPWSLNRSAFPAKCGEATPERGDKHMLLRDVFDCRCCIAVEYPSLRSSRMPVRQVSWLQTVGDLHHFHWCPLSWNTKGVSPRGLILSTVALQELSPSYSVFLSRISRRGKSCDGAFHIRSSAAATNRMSTMYRPTRAQIVPRAAHFQCVVYEQPIAGHSSEERRC
jgi:hypothetical protein